MASKSDTTDSFASGNDDPDDANYKPQDEDDSEGEEKDHNTGETSKKASKNMSDAESDMLLKLCLEEFKKIRNTETGKGPTGVLDKKQKELETAQAWQRIQQVFQEQTKVYFVYLLHLLLLLTTCRKCYRLGKRFQ